MPPKFHQGMHLDCSSLMIKLSPWTKLQTQLYSTSVKGVDHFIQVKSKFLSLICILCLPYQYLCKVLIDTPILLSIGFDQGGFGDYLDTRTLKVSRIKVKCSLYVFQPGSVRELRKAHYHELVTVNELNGVPVTLIAVDALLTIISNRKFYHLHNLLIIN